MLHQIANLLVSILFDAISFFRITYFHSVASQAGAEGFHSIVPEL